MADEDSSVSPYLLRPLRTLEQVLSGRSKRVELGYCNINDRHCGQDEQARANVEPFHDSPSTDASWGRLQP